ncbi:MAG: ankyrin repeat domain-containing protein [Planctomycetaceae bacterium]
MMIARTGMTKTSVGSWWSAILVGILCSVGCGADRQRDRGDVTLEYFRGYCWGGDTEQVRRILSIHPEWASSDLDGGGSPLHWTAGGFGKDAEIAELLIQYGAPVNEVDRLGETPLCRAASKGNLPIAKLLVEAGADVNFTFAWRYGGGWRGMSPLDIAAGYDEPQLVRFLLDQGAKLSHPNQYMHAIHHACWRVGGRLKNRNGSNQEVIEMLIEAGADINDARGILGITPLMRAIEHKEVSTIRYLLTRTDLRINQPRPEEAGGTTALDDALEGLAEKPGEDIKQIVDMLRKHGAKTKQELAKEAAQGER